MDAFTGRFTLAACVCLLLCGETTAGRGISGGGRSLLQTAQPPVAAPSGTSVLYQFRGLGTQNYTALSTGNYSNTGAVADLYSDTTLEGHHFYNTKNQPTWTVNDPITGKQLGLVSGMAQVRVAVPKQPGDGGYGSVAEVLLIAVAAEGKLKDVTYIERLNTLGGVAPTNLTTLAAYKSIANFQLAIPYQSDYVFLTGGGPPAPALAPAPATPAPPPSSPSFPFNFPKPHFTFP